MQLKEIVTEILEKKFGGSTRKMANALQLGEMDIRRAAGIDPGSRRNQEKTFQLTMKILPICRELKISAAQDLITLAPEDLFTDVEGDDKTARRPPKRAKARTKKKGFGVVSARRITGNQGKDR